MESSYLYWSSDLERTTDLEALKSLCKERIQSGRNLVKVIHRAQTGSTIGIWVPYILIEMMADGTISERTLG